MLQTCIVYVTVLSIQGSTHGDAFIDVYIIATLCRIIISHGNKSSNNCLENVKHHEWRKLALTNFVWERKLDMFRWHMSMRLLDAYDALHESAASQDWIKTIIQDVVRGRIANLTRLRFKVNWGESERRKFLFCWRIKHHLYYYFELSGKCKFKLTSTFWLVFIKREQQDWSVR